MIKKRSFEELTPQEIAIMDKISLSFGCENCGKTTDEEQLIRNKQMIKYNNENKPIRFLWYCGDCLKKVNPKKKKI